jgi:two-component system NtrC family response regulator
LKVLLADDEASITATLEEDLREAGHETTAVASGDAALDHLRQERFDVLIADINMPGMKGDQLLREAKALDPELSVIVITGFGTIESAVAAMKDGATDYILKPFLNEQITALLQKLARMRDLETENRALRAQIEDIAGFENIVGKSPPMQEVFRIVRTVARTDANILIVGETGTGKEMVARAIHNKSPRRHRPLVAISCAAIPSTLLEDELFGHERGAFTDARERKIGRIERSEGGTFFLDDIDDMPLATQVKLLRVLQEREIERLGGDRSIQVDIRVIAATKVDLRQLVRQGRFREDLFYRLNVVPLRLPPLRERTGDVPLLARHFIARYGQGRAYEVKPEVLEAMEAYYWPGNVRELEHAIERAIALAGHATFLKKEHLVERSPRHKLALQVPERIRTLREVAEEAEREHIQEVLKITGDHRAQAASILGISRKNLWEKMKFYGIGGPEDAPREDA